MLRGTHARQPSRSLSHIYLTGGPVHTRDGRLVVGPRAADQLVLPDVLVPELRPSAVFFCIGIADGVPGVRARTCRYAFRPPRQELSSGAWPSHPEEVSCTDSFPQRPVARRPSGCLYTDGILFTGSNVLGVAGVGADRPSRMPGTHFCAITNMP